jgi:recombination protein RecT
MSSLIVNPGSGVFTDTKPLNRVATMQELLSNVNALEQIRSVAAKHASPERMLRVLRLSLDGPNGKAFRAADPMSVLGGLMSSAALGLEANGPLGLAYLVPFKNTWKSNKAKTDVYDVQLVIGWRGYLQLMHQSGSVSGVIYGVHRSDDRKWAYNRASFDGPMIVHEEGAGLGEILHAYAGIGIKGGAAIVVCWPIEKIRAHRDQYSKAYQYAVKKGGKDLAETPWVKNEEIMAIKTMFRQLAKFAPMSVEQLHIATAIDSRAMDFAAFARAPEAGIPLEIGDEADGPEALDVDPDAGAGAGDDGGKKRGRPAAGSKPADPEPAGAEDAAVVEPGEPSPSEAEKAAAMAAAAEAAEAARRAAAAVARPSAEDRYAATVSQIIRDLEDCPVGGEKNVLDGVWQVEVGEIKAFAPAKFAEIEEWIKQRAEMVGGPDDGDPDADPFADGGE